MLSVHINVCKVPGTDIACANVTAQLASALNLGGRSSAGAHFSVQIPLDPSVVGPGDTEARILFWVLSNVDAVGTRLFSLSKADLAEGSVPPCPRTLRLFGWVVVCRIN